MKRNFLSLLLLPLFLVSCSRFNDEPKTSEKENEETQETEESPKTEYYPLVYDGPTTICLNYGATYQIEGIHLEGTDKDSELTYSIHSNTFSNAATISENGLVTAMEYDWSVSQNTNENVVVTVRSKYAQNPSSISIRFVICHFAEGADFQTIMDGGNFYFYTSTGIVENLKCHYSDAAETDPWYAECTLVEENTGKYFHTTISKSFNYLTLDDKLVTSHFKTVIKRDEKGSATAKDIKNGSKIRFLTMLRYNEEFGYTNDFNTIMLDEISIPDMLCTVTSINPNITVNKTTGRYDEEFIVTREENTPVYVMGEHAQIFAERYLDDNQIQGVYKFKSSRITVYSSNNIPDPSLYGTYPNGSNTSGYLDFNNDKQALHDYLFDNNEGFRITRFRLIREIENGFNVGDGSSTCPYLVISVDPSLHITSFECTVASINSSRPTRVKTKVNDSLKDLLLPKGSSPTTFSSYGSYTPITEITFYAYPREVYEHLDMTGFSVINLRLYSRGVLVSTL